MPRQLTLVPAPADPLDLLGPLRAALAGTAPLAVLPTGPVAVVDAARAALRPDEPVEDGGDLVVLTSGSTGRGRAVLLPARALRASGEATHARLGGPGAWLLALPVTAIAGLQVLCRSLLAGTRPAVLAPGEPLVGAVARMPAGRRYASLVPTQLRRYLDVDADRAALESLDAVLVGGAATDPALLDRARAAGIAVVTTYGMSETAGGCVYDGRPLDGVAVRVDDGGVALAGPVLAAGYRGDPAGTAEAFGVDADGERWFATRDAGELDRGRLTVTGRLDDVVLTGGVNVAPQAVERVLREHSAVTDAVVFGRPDPEWGAVVVAAVVAAPGTEPALVELRSWVAQRLGAPSAPRELHRIPAVPLLHTGKPDRRAVAASISPAPTSPASR